MNRPLNLGASMSRRAAASRPFPLVPALFFPWGGGRGPRPDMPPEPAPAREFSGSRRVGGLRGIRTRADDRPEGRPRRPVLLHPVDELCGDLRFDAARPPDRKDVL